MYKYRLKCSAKNSLSLYYIKCLNKHLSELEFFKEDREKNYPKANFKNLYELTMVKTICKNDSVADRFYNTYLEDCSFKFYSIENFLDWISDFDIEKFKQLMMGKVPVITHHELLHYDSEFFNQTKLSQILSISSE